MAKKAGMPKKRKQPVFDPEPKRDPEFWAKPAKNDPAVDALVKEVAARLDRDYRKWERDMADTITRFVRTEGFEDAPRTKTVQRRKRVTHKRVSKTHR